MSVVCYHQLPEFDSMDTSMQPQTHIFIQFEKRALNIPRYLRESTGLQFKFFNLVQWLFFPVVCFVQGTLISKMFPSKSTKWIILNQIFKSGAAPVSFAIGLSWLRWSNTLSFKEASGASYLASMSVESSATGTQKMSVGLNEPTEIGHGIVEQTRKSSPRDWHPTSFICALESAHSEHGLEMKDG